MNKQDWTYKKLGEVATIYDSQRKPVTKKDRVNGIYPYYGATGIQDYVDSYLFDGRYLLLGEDGAKWGANDKSAFIIEGKSWVNNHAHIMRFDDRIIDSFVEYYLNGKDLTEYITGAVVPKLTQAKLTQIPIPVPPIEEQERIVDELDLLSGIIEKKKEQLKAYDQLAQSIFYTMFGDPIDNPKGWEVKKLGEIANCTSGGTPSRRVPRFFEGTINWFSAGELNNMYLRDSIEKITQEALDNSNAKLCPANSLFIGMYDTAAFKLGIPIKDSASNQACANVELSNDNVIWLYYSLLLMRDEALKHRHGARQKNLSLRFIKDFYVPVPPLSLQEEFAEKVEAIERQKALVQQSIVETQTMFDFTMDKYFG